MDVDALIELSNKRSFIKIAEPGVYPDGPTIDAEGNIWIALFGGWGMRCYSPLGELRQTIRLPTAPRLLLVAMISRPSTLRQRGLASLRMSARNNLWRVLFSVRMNVRGLAQNVFAAYQVNIIGLIDSPITHD